MGTTRGVTAHPTLTVQDRKPGSHQGKGWENFTDTVIRTISYQKEHVVFLLWGAYAQKKVALIDASSEDLANLQATSERVGEVWGSCKSPQAAGREIPTNWLAAFYVDFPPKPVIILSPLKNL